MMSPEIGEIRSASQLGFKEKCRYIYHACVDCGKPRWVKFIKSQPDSLRCRNCNYKRNAVFLKHQTGDKHPNWKGGSYRDGDGYIVVKLETQSFFYPMCHTRSYLFEHRLIMARHLGRCLKPKEYVHHKNGIKDDNRIENLELFGSVGEHSKRHSLGYQEGFKEGYQNGINAKNEELQQEIIILKQQLDEIKKTGGVQKWP